MGHADFRHLRIDEPVLRAALSKAAAERRSEVKTQPELVGKSAKPIERRFIRMLMEAEGLRRELAQRLQQGGLYRGLETEKVFAALIVAALAPISPCRPRKSSVVRDRRMLFEILFDQDGTWEEAESCLEALRHHLIEQELAEVQRSIEANAAGRPCANYLLASRTDETAGGGTLEVIS